MKNFRELQVWEKAHHLTLAVYQITATFPREELYGLTTQLRRLCSSIPANLAEGCGRNGNAELVSPLLLDCYGFSERTGVSPVAVERPEADRAENFARTN